MAIEFIDEKQAEKLNRLAEEMIALRDTPGAEAAYWNKRTDLLAALYMQQFPIDGAPEKQRNKETEQRHEVFCLFLEGDFPKFDPTQGTFSKFFAWRMKRREVDVLRKETKASGCRREDDDDEQAFCSGDGALSEKTPPEPAPKPPVGGETAKSVQTAKRRPQTRELDVSLVSLAALLLTPAEGLPRDKKLRGKKREHFRLCFTDFLVFYIQNSDRTDSALCRRERDVLQAVKLSFLDFFMEDECRSIDEIRASEKKALDCMVDERTGTVPNRYPMPNKTYITYLTEVENTPVNKSRVSQFKKEFREYFQLIL